MEKKELENYMKIAIEESRKSLKLNNVPVGCLILNEKNKEVVSSSHNGENFLDHAEITAIGKLGINYLRDNSKDLSIFTTIEPCVMCFGSILLSGIKKIYFGARNEKFGYSNYIIRIEGNNKKLYKNMEVKGNILEKETKKNLKIFFNIKRNE